MSSKDVIVIPKKRKNKTIIIPNVNKPVSKPVKKEIKRQINRSTEKKHKRFYNTHVWNTGTVAASLFNVSLTNISSGTLVNERIGSKLKITGIRLKFNHIEFATNGRLLRIMIIRAKNPADSPDMSTYTDLYEDESFADFAPTSLQKDSVVPINRDVFSVLYDKVFSVPNYGVTKTLVFNKWLKIKANIEYKTLGSNTASNGRIFLVGALINHDGTSDATNARLTYMAEVYYTDQ